METETKTTDCESGECKDTFSEIWGTPIDMLELAISHLRDGRILEAEMIVVEVSEILHKPRG